MALAELMLDAYQGTIDDEGEDLADAVTEIDGWLALSDSRPALSSVALDDDAAVGAILVCDFGAAAFVSFVITRASSKGRGVATALLAGALADLAEAGFQRVEAVITSGNVSSERLFGSAGFTQGEPIAAT